MTTYYNIDIHVSPAKEEILSYTLNSYINTKSNSAIGELNNNGIKNTILIGDGDKIIDQYPKRDVVIHSKEKVFLLTNGRIFMPNMSGWSKKDVKQYCALAGVDVAITGNGYVSEQSIGEGTILDKDKKLMIHLSQKYGV